MVTMKLLRTQQTTKYKIPTLRFPLKWVKTSQNITLDTFGKKCLDRKIHTQPLSAT